MEKFTISFKQIDNDVIATSNEACANTTKHAYILGNQDNCFYYTEYEFYNLESSYWERHNNKSRSIGLTNLTSMPENGDWYIFAYDGNKYIFTKCTEGTHDHLTNLSE